MRFVRLIVVAVVIGTSVRAAADTFELKDGGRIVGSVVDRTDDGGYVIRTVDGAEATLERMQIARVVEQDKTRLEYERRSRSAPDTAAAHRQLAAWCREHELGAEAEHHLQRVVELDPEDEAARRSLGFQRVGRRWLSREALMGERGMVLFEGKYRSAQDIAIRQRDNAVGNEEANWHRQLRTWRGWLDHRREDRVAEGRRNIAQIADPNATPALVQLLADEDDPWVFDLLLETLGRMDDPLAMQTLVRYSLDYDDANVREECLAYLVGGDRPASILPYIEALGSKDNVIVNRAGTALGRIGNPEAISPLIDALVTTHQVATGAGGPGSIGAGFDPSGSSAGFSMGAAPQVVEKDFNNLGVLRALTRLSGNQNFEYDEQAWRHWYVDLQMRQRYNARRDE